MSTPTFAQTTRYGDFLSAQMKSLRKFGYGMFVCKMKAADGPSCSTFWLYSDAPAPGCMPEIAQLWRWNEFDVEFVPQTQATQNSYATIDGTLPNATVDFYGSELDINSMPNGTIGQNSPYVTWKKGRDMTDDTVMSDMQQYYNRWMTDRKAATQIPSTQFNLAGAEATTGPDHQVNGDGSSTNNKPGWPNASVWKYPLTATNDTPSACDMTKMTALNVWRTPKGEQTVDVKLPTNTTGGTKTETYSCIEKLPAIDGSTAASSITAAALNNETYVFPGTNSDFDPYSGLNTYTMVWTPGRVAFYINAGSDGTDVDNATPIMVYDVEDYPSLAQSGTQAAQGEITWADTSLADKLGHVSINLANYVGYKAAKNLPNDTLTTDQMAGDGWSGAPPAETWAGDDAEFRSVKFYPLISEESTGTKKSDFTTTGDEVWGFDMSDGTWTAANFQSKINEFFGILYAQDHTHVFTSDSEPLRDSKSPLAVSYDTATDGDPVMKLSCKTSTDSPQRNFFRIATNMKTGTPISAGNPFMFVTCEYDGNTIPCSGASTPLAFYAPAAGKSTTATISLYMSKTFPGTFPASVLSTIKPDATAQLKLETSAKGDISWSVIPGSDSNGIIIAYQSENPHLITVQQGSATPGS